MGIEKDLKDKGFIEFSNNILSKDAKTSYQLRVRDAQGVTKYFINADLYNFSYVQCAHDSMKGDLQPQFSVQYHSKRGTFDVAYFGDNLQEVLDFYEDMFERMECIHYDR